MRHVSLAALEAKIVRPGFEEHLKPLLRYRGCLSLGRAHRLWNLVLSGMEHEATAADITQRLVLNPEYSQLCLPDKRVAFVSLSSFRGRLMDNPRLLAEAPGLEEYLNWIIPSYKRIEGLYRVPDPPEDFVPTVERQSIAWAAREYGVERGIAERWFRELGLISTGGTKRRPDSFAKWAEGKSLAWAVERYDIGYTVARRWFAEIALEPKRERQQAIVYPFLIHDGGKPEHTLLRRVSAAVPQGLDPSLRADMCQDLIVGILAGDLMESELDMPSAELTRRIWKSAPSRYAERSLDDVIGDTSLTIMDTLADEGRDWA